MKRFPYKSNDHDECKYCNKIGYVICVVGIIIVGLMAGGTL